MRRLGGAFAGVGVAVALVGWMGRGHSVEAANRTDGVSKKVATMDIPLTVTKGDGVVAGR
jgi:hypothetical protein